MSATEILVIILAAALAIFLILAIVLTILLIRVTRQIYAVTTSARVAAENVERMSSSISKLVTPAAIFKAFKDKKRRSKD